MKKLSLYITGIISAVLLLPSCRRNISVYEALQVPVDIPIYTACNIWYENPSDISNRNSRNGTLIPFGTRIEVEELTDETMVFRIAGRDLPLTYKYRKKWGVYQFKYFLRGLLATEDKRTQEQALRPEFLPEIRAGKVVKGMLPGEVIKSWGVPSPHRTPLRSSPTWIYWRSDSKPGNVRVIFNKGHVSEIIKL